MPKPTCKSGPIIHLGQGDFPIDAKNLYEFLGVKTELRNWIARRIKYYGFSEGSDFRSILTESKGGRPRKEYHLTLDMAKELSMVERTERGREARRYFIECERKLREGSQPRIAHQPQRALPATDSFALFINRKCEFGPYEMRKDVLFNTYRQFCQVNGYLVEPRNLFFRELYTHGQILEFRPRGSGGRRDRRIRGIRPIDPLHTGPNNGINEDIRTIMESARTTKTRINPHDLALLKIGRDIMNQIWQRLLPDEPGRSLSA